MSLWNVDSHETTCTLVWYHTQSLVVQCVNCKFWTPEGNTDVHALIDKGLIQAQLINGPIYVGFAFVAIISEGEINLWNVLQANWPTSVWKRTKCALMHFELIWAMLQNVTKFPSTCYHFMNGWYVGGAFFIFHFMSSTGCILMTWGYFMTIVGAPPKN